MTKNQREFKTEEELRAWYNNYRWYHGRLAQLVAQFLESKIEQYFSDKRLPVLAKISYREKTLESLEENLEQKAYGEFPIARERIRDIAGVRIVFYFADDVDSFCDNPATLFLTWFGTYAHNNREYNTGLRSKSWDGLSPDYRSYHFPIKVDPGYPFFLALNTMDKEFLAGLYCEVQIRSALQDAWAEANHDIRYKLRQVGRNQREKTLTQAFHYLAEQLYAGDETLKNVKKDYLEHREEAHDEGEGRGRSRKRQWFYRQPRFEHAASIEGVQYEYELLDPPHSELLANFVDGRHNLHAPFTVRAATTVFNVDHAFEMQTGVRRYKRSMWELLKKTEAQFVVAITYDSMVVRVTDWNRSTRTLDVELAAYSDQVVTNHKRSQDKVIPGSTLQVQDLAADANGALLPFSKSPLSNTVGVCCVIKTFEEEGWAIGLRSTSVAFDPGVWGCSASGALNWVELGSWDNHDFEGWFKNGIMREVEEELGYTPDPGEVHYLAFAREFGRVGKPQVFFHIDAKIPCVQLSEKFRTYKRVDSEYQALRFLDRSQVLDLISSDEERVNRVCNGAVVGEELRFNLALAMLYTGEIEATVSD